MHASTGPLGREKPGERRAPDMVRVRADAAYGCVDWYCYDTPLTPPNSQQLGAIPGSGALREPSRDAKVAHAA
jgi:hypothetical protein